MSVKMYSANAKTQLERNFNVSEFKCKCGDNHEICISPKFVKHLQKLTDVLDADKVIIVSGHRCAKHDINVGGNGRGWHTIGYAADCTFWKDGDVIDPKYVACKAQDLEFKGIAVIGYIGQKNCTNIHLDDSPTRKWYGDETVKGGTDRSVTDDFYKYYNISNTNNDYIRKLQKTLNNLGCRISIDGIVGPQTLTNVRKFTIDMGDNNALVEWIQDALNYIGYDCGDSDGIVGPKTFNAINDFQRKNKLGVGYFGGSDWNKLLELI